jgi:hypothetical protein
MSKKEANCDLEADECRVTGEDIVVMIASAGAPEPMAVFSRLCWGWTVAIRKERSVVFSVVVQVDFVVVFYADMISNGTITIVVAG